MENTSVSAENLLDDVSEADFAGVTLTLSPLSEAGRVSSRRLLHQDQPGVLTSTSCTFVFVLMGLIFIALFLLAEFYVWVQKDIHLLLLRRGDWRSVNILTAAFNGKEDMLFLLYCVWICFMHGYSTIRGFMNPNTHFRSKV